MKNKILLVEDDAISVVIYEKILKKSGFEVENVRLGSEALKLLEEIKQGNKQTPDLVLLDLILPDANGIQILEKFRKEKETKDLAFIILTNYIDRNTKKAGERLGAKEYVVKTDIVPSELVKVVKKYL